MTNKQIFKKAAYKAIDNGYDATKESIEEIIEELENSPTMFESLCMSVIFSHDFAKAFWRDYDEGFACECCDDFWYSYKFCSKCGKKLKKTKRVNDNYWKKNLQTMVLEKDPIKYLEKFL